MSGHILGSFPRAEVNTQHPEAFAVCDRCGFVYNHKDLQWQMEWRGNSLQSTGFLVCDPCLDIPHQFDRPVPVPPDPVPVKDARPPQWQSQMIERQGTPAFQQEID